MLGGRSVREAIRGPDLLAGPQDQLYQEYGRIVPDATRLALELQ